MIKVKLPILEDDVVRCVPFENSGDEEYLTNLVVKSKYTKINKRIIEDIYAKGSGYFWSIYDKASKRKGGVVYFTYLHDKIWLHAYKDDKLAKKLNSKGDYSYKAAKLLIDFISNNIESEIWTTHPLVNRGATLVCRRLGLKCINNVDTPYGKYIVMRRNKDGS